MKQVTLLGSGNSAYECPFEGELWATESMLPWIDPDCSKAFIFNGNKKALEIAQKHNIAIVSTEPYATEKFPIEEILGEFGINQFGCCTAYMIAYALYLDYDKIKLYGIDQGNEWHHIHNKHYITFWLGVAKGRGIAVEIGRSCGLYRVIKENVRDMYERKRQFKERVKQYKYFADVANAKIDPYSFVSGSDPSAITIKHRDEHGNVVSEWYHTT